MVAEVTGSGVRPFDAAEAERRLEMADRLLGDPELVAEGVWPRACAWLIRLALEHALDAFWARHRPPVAEATRRAQLIVLTRTVDPDLGRRCAELWQTLSRAAHHHAYELAPTAVELRSWLDAARDVVAQFIRR